MESTVLEIVERNWLTLLVLRLAEFANYSPEALMSSISQLDWARVEKDRVWEGWGYGNCSEGSIIIFLLFSIIIDNDPNKYLIILQLIL